MGRKVCLLSLLALFVCSAGWSAQRTDRLDLINGTTSSGRLDIYEDADNGSNKTRLQVPAMAADITYTLPPDDGDASEVLTSDGSGVLTWEAVAGSGDITAVGDVASGAAFNGSQGTTLTFNNAGGDKTISYDGSEFTISTNTAVTGSFSATNIQGTNGTLTALTLTNALTTVNGGTGSAGGFSLYSPIFAGTTTTGAFQTGSLGSSGHVLTSNGPGALPTFKAATGGAGTPGGSDTQVQFNDSSSFGGDSGMTYNKTTNTFTTTNSTITNGTTTTLTSTNATVTGTITTGNTKSGSAIFGSGTGFKTATPAFSSDDVGYPYQVSVGQQLVGNDPIISNFAVGTHYTPTSTSSQQTWGQFNSLLVDGSVPITGEQIATFNFAQYAGSNTISEYLVGASNEASCSAGTCTGPVVGSQNIVHSYTGNTTTSEYATDSYFARGGSGTVTSVVMYNGGGILDYGGTNAVTNFYGFKHNSQTIPTNVYGFYSDQAANANRYQLYMGGTAKSYINGNVGIGNTSPTYTFDVTGSIRATGTLNLGTALTTSMGGTGSPAGFSTYSPIFAGTTSTSAFQSGSLGLTGHVLTSNGAGALPTFQVSTASTITGSTLSQLPQATAATMDDLFLMTDDPNGTPTSKYITTSSLIGSGTRLIVFPVSSTIAPPTTTTGQNCAGDMSYQVGTDFNNYKITSVYASSSSATSAGSGAITLNIRNRTDAVNVLSTALTIDATERSSTSAATPAVINTSNQTVTTDDDICVQVTNAGSGSSGLQVTVGLTKT